MLRKGVVVPSEHTSDTIVLINTELPLTSLRPRGLDIILYLETNSREQIYCKKGVKKVSARVRGRRHCSRSYPFSFYSFPLAYTPFFLRFSIPKVQQRSWTKFSSLSSCPQSFYFLSFLFPTYLANVKLPDHERRHFFFYLPSSRDLACVYIYVHTLRGFSLSLLLRSNFTDDKNLRQHSHVLKVRTFPFSFFTLSHASPLLFKLFFSQRADPPAPRFYCERPLFLACRHFLGKTLFYFIE